MAIVALHYPVRVLSLSASALDRGEGIWHFVYRIHGPAQVRDTLDPLNLNSFENHWADDPDAISVKTLCGKEIGAYPETHQTHIRPCMRCLNYQHAETAHWSRILPPIAESERNDRWSQYYWRDHGGMFAL